MGRGLLRGMHREPSNSRVNIAAGADAVSMCRQPESRTVLQRFSHNVLKWRNQPTHRAPRPVAACLIKHTALSLCRPATDKLGGSFVAAGDSISSVDMKICRQWNNHTIACPVVLLYCSITWCIVLVVLSICCLWHAA
jgi:hypothetical protein